MHCGRPGEQPSMVLGFAVEKERWWRSSCSPTMRSSGGSTLVILGKGCPLCALTARLRSGLPWDILSMDSRDAIDDVS